MAEVRDWRAGPEAVDVERGLKVTFIIGREWHSPGVILDAQGVVRWTYEIHPKRSSYSPLNLLARPEWVLTEVDGPDVLRLRRISRLPLRFEMIENGARVGTIRRRGLLRNRYAVEFASGPAWTIHLPLYTLRFGGASSAGEKVWIWVGPPKLQWNLLFESGTENARLLAALAFIHREWWCYA